MTIRFHDIDGTYNLRDTGGYAAEGGVTRWGTLYRSDALHRLSAGAADAFRALGVGTVVDLRDEHERRDAPSLIDGYGIEVRHAPIFESSGPPSSWGSTRLQDLYDHVVDTHGARLARAVAAVSLSERPVLVHCTAGKDRTGLVVALTLLTVGVDRESVVEDYAHTESRLAGAWVADMLAQMERFGVQPSPGLEQLVSASPPELMHRVIDRIEASHGSAAEYLAAHGLGDDGVLRLRAALVEPAP